eukprot:125493_1
MSNRIMLLLCHVFLLISTLHYKPTKSISQSGGIILKGGNNYMDDPYNGRVEICHDWQWGTICDDLYPNSLPGPGNTEASKNAACKVICNQLGYTTCDDTTGLIDNAAKPYASGGSERTWLDNTVCTGTETKIEDCTHKSWGSEDCSHSEDITVQCSGYVGGGYVSTTCNAPTPPPTPSPTSLPTPAPTS